MSTPPPPPEPRKKDWRDRFNSFAHRVSELVGSAWAFMAALLVIAGWAVTGPVFAYSDTWQLFINTGTTIITFLMVFLIQSTQNRDSRAVHLKLDELIRATKSARNNLVDLENLSERELQTLTEEFKRLHEHACHEAEHRVQHRKRN